MDQLVARVRQGDPTGLQALHDSYSDRIFFIALKELRSRSDAEDVRNETLVRVADALRADRLVSTSTLAGFVLGTARNVIREHFRKNLRAEPLEGRDFAGASDTSAMDHTEKRALEMVLGRLKPREREFVRLYYYEELSKEEISQRLGISEDRLRLIKSRTLKSFRELYDRFTAK